MYVRGDELKPNPPRGRAQAQPYSLPPAHDDDAVVHDHHLGVHVDDFGDGGLEAGLQVAVAEAT